MLKQHKLLIPTIIAILILLAAAAGYLLSRPQGDELASSIVVSLAEAAGEQEAIPAGSVFAITSDYRLSEEQLRGLLEIEPKINYSLTGGGKSWQLKPTMPLSDNTVYTFQVKNQKDEPIWSFAFQTRSDLMVNAVYPNDGYSYTSVHTGIEVKFNASEVDLSQGFEIKPEISGRFESSGYTSTFVPSQPLTENSVYRVTIKAGVSAANGMTLQKDYAFSFETRSQENLPEEKWGKLRLDGSFAETFLPGDTLAVAMSGGQDVAGQSFDMSLYRFPDLGVYAQEQKAYDTFYKERFGEKRDYLVNADKLEKVIEISGELYRKEDYGNWYAILPEDLAAGQYLFTLSGKDANGVPQYLQKMIQIVNLSVYNLSTDGDTLFWINDPVTGDPLSGAGLDVVDVDSGHKVTGQTMGDGTVRLMTGETKAIYLTINRNGIPVYFSREDISAQTQAPVSQQFYTAIYTDREIYQPDDTIRFWGTMRPRRAGAALPENAYMVLGMGREGNGMELRGRRYSLRQMAALAAS